MGALPPHPRSRVNGGENIQELISETLLDKL